MWSCGHLWLIYGSWDSWECWQCQARGWQVVQVVYWTITFAFGLALLKSSVAAFCRAWHSYAAWLSARRMVTLLTQGWHRDNRGQQPFDFWSTFPLVQTSLGEPWLKAKKNPNKNHESTIDIHALGRAIYVYLISFFRCLWIPGTLGPALVVATGSTEPSTRL